MENKRKQRGYWTKETVIKEIRLRKELGKSLNSSDTLSEYSSLVVKAIKFYGDWSNALKAAGIDYNQWHNRRPRNYWSKDKIIEEIQKRQREGKSLATKDVKFEDSELYYATTKYFSTWRKGLIQASVIDSKDYISYKKRTWHKERVRNELLIRKNSNLSLKPSDIKTEWYTLYRRTIEFYGNFENALTDIGVNPSKLIRKNKRVWTEELIINELKKRKKENAQLNSIDVNNDDPGLYQAILKHCGGWKKVKKLLE